MHRLKTAVALGLGGMRGLEMRDVLTFGGVGVAVWGLWPASPTAALVVAGGALFYLGAIHPLLWRWAARRGS